MVRALIDVVCIPQEAQHFMGWADGEINLMFCTDDGSISGRDCEWVQDALTVTVSMFYRMGIDANLKKTKVVVFTPRLIWRE